MASDDRRERGLKRDDRLIDADAESLSFDPLGRGQRTPRAAQTRDETAALRASANVAAHDQKVLEAAYTDTLEQVKAGVDVLPERNNHTLLESLRESSERVVELETAAEVAERCEERRLTHGGKRGHVRRTATHEGDSKKITGSDRTPERPADPSFAADPEQDAHAPVGEPRPVRRAFLRSGFFPAKENPKMYRGLDADRADGEKLAPPQSPRRSSSTRRISRATSLRRKRGRAPRPSALARRVTRSSDGSPARSRVTWRARRSFAFPMERRARARSPGSPRRKCARSPNAWGCCSASTPSRRCTPRRTRP